MFTLNCKGKLLVIEKPVVMGILNVTPDSFYPGSRVWGDLLLDRAQTMLEQGAAILDIGGQSTRPGSLPVDESEELQRVVPAIASVCSHFPDCIVSVDTYYAGVARAAVEAGASIVNDISAGNASANMLSTVAALGVPFVVMHMKGMPGDMQQNPAYEDVCREVLDFFVRKTAECTQAGIHDLILDPGFGFGKTIGHNFEILKNLDLFKILGRPLICGLSRKSTVYRTLGISPEQALNGTTVLNTLSLANGAHILRVHDVLEAVEAIRLFSAYSV